MDYKKSKAPVNTVTRNIMDLCKDTDNIYESVAIIAKRANQISAQIKEDLSKKLAEFASYNDSLEEVFENREQIEISRYYEKLPRCWQHRSSSRTRSTGVTPRVRISSSINHVSALFLCGNVNKPFS